jgi:hypothetical protein
VSVSKPASLFCVLGLLTIMMYKCGSCDVSRCMVFTGMVHVHASHGRIARTHPPPPPPCCPPSQMANVLYPAAVAPHERIFLAGKPASAMYVAPQVCVEVNGWLQAGVWHGVAWCGVMWRGVCWYVAFGMVSRVCRGRGVGVGVVVPKSRSRHDIRACFVPLE